MWIGGMKDEVRKRYELSSLYERRWDMERKINREKMKYQCEAVRNWNWDMRK